MEVRAASLQQLEAAGCLPVQVEGHSLVLIHHDGRVHALDNRCPHMGFPLHQGTVGDGILTCHWHSARFDLQSGGTFDLFADDVRVFPVELRDGEVYVDLSGPSDRRGHQRRRLRVGLERDIPLVIAKAVVHLMGEDGGARQPFRTGLQFGTRYRAGGWGPGLTTLTCFMNLLPGLERPDRPRALYHGLSAVADDAQGMAPRFAIEPLPGGPTDPATLKGWFRRFVEVRDDEGAERCLVTAIQAGLSAPALADLLFAAATDHRYLQVGHVLDFTNKALEALDAAGWELAGPVLPSLVSAYARARRMEESNAWRHPVDLVAILERAFEALPEALAEPAAEAQPLPAGDLAGVLLGDDPQAVADSLLEALRRGSAAVDVAASVAHAAALRIARFPTSNEFGDWDTALHTLTFANAVHQGLRRRPSVELVRGVFDAAMSVYLDRFLNVPPAPLPPPSPAADPAAVLEELPELLDARHQVDQAGARVASYLDAGGGASRLKARLGGLLLREDRDFHTIQTVEAAFRLHDQLPAAAERRNVLVAAVRYLAAHAPTMRAQGQTFEIALRLQRGDRLYEEAH